MPLQLLGMADSFVVSGWLEKKSGGHHDDGSYRSEGSYRGHSIRADSTRSEDGESSPVRSTMKALSNKIENNLVHNWKRRWFVMEPKSAELKYYSSKETYDGRSVDDPCLGSLDCQGVKIYLKEVSDSGVHRFTLLTEKRDLKLRACQEDYELWAQRLRECGGKMWEPTSEDLTAGREIHLAGPVSYRAEKSRITDQLRKLGLTRSSKPKSQR